MAGERNEVSKPSDTKAVSSSAPATDPTTYETATVADIERRLDEKRAAIGRKISEIKTTMTTEYATTKHKVEETLDWRNQMTRYPLAACLGALAVGFLAGQTLGRRVSGPSSSRSLGHGGGGLSGGHISTASSFSPSGNEGAHSEGRMGHMLQSAMHTQMFGRVEDTLSQVAEHFLSEVSRVGKEMIVPSVVSSLTAAFQNSSMGRRAAGGSNGGGSAAAGFSSSSPSYGNEGAAGPYEGRSI